MQIHSPLCFSAVRAFQLWQHAARASAAGDSDYCADCTPAYKAQMLAAQRCAYPNTTFRRDREGFLEGVRAEADQPSQRRADPDEPIRKRA